MPKFKVLLTDYAWADLDIERRILHEAGAELVQPPATDPASLAAAAADADAIMTNWVKVPESVIAAAPRLRIIARLGIGLDNIDVEAATRRGVVVTNVPDYCLIEVAEHTVALLLALARKVAFYHKATKSGQYDLRAGFPLRRIEGQTLGLVGLGNIGRRVAQKASGLGLRILATARNRNHSPPPGVQWRDLDALLAESDFVSLHAPLTPQTRHLIGAEQLARMKPTACLINTARGALIDTPALTRALSAGRLAGAALDVQEQEPPNLREPPYNDPHVIVTPHSAFISEESLADMRVRSSRQVIARLTGGVPECVINPAVLAAAAPADR